MSAVIRTQVEKHAAHYRNGSGHDLEWFIFEAPKNERPADMPADAQYHSGFMRGGRQFWAYCRTLPLSPGRCGRCP